MLKIIRRVWHIVRLGLFKEIRIIVTRLALDTETGVQDVFCLKNLRPFYIGIVLYYSLWEGKSIWKNMHFIWNQYIDYKSKFSSLRSVLQEKNEYE